jgi:tetratricopeptide (TPR) repeat protein
MGIVYEARDRELGRNVALKTLLTVDANSIYLFKQEFRTLADVHHRNLVHLYELVQPDDGPVFFAMELVAGADFLAHVSGAAAMGEDSRGSSSQTSSPRSAVTRRPPRMEKVPPSDAGPAPLADHLAHAERLRPALRQIVKGLRALHCAGKLHRDIKPSNVLVTPEGRVVILDFGVALELKRALTEADDTVVGTPAYMSPEQAMAEPLTPASDWYSVGVMLYKALTGRTPFVGSAAEMLTAKAMREALPPSAHASNIPRDLEELAIDLLRMDPAGRPEADEILRRLGGISSARPAGRSERFTENVELVGREEPLRALRDAFQASCEGRAVAVRIGGRAGMGKSALVQRFVDDLAAAGDAVVLCGRAYERESVPYKGIDSVVDALAQLLTRIEEDGDVIPKTRRAAALVRLFPVLRRIPSLAAVEEQAIDDPARVRRRAFRALGELLTSLAKRKPTVVYIDDVQWSDVDSAALLAEIMRPDVAPPILLLLTYREEDEETSPFLAAMEVRWPRGAELRELTVEPLTTDQAERLVLAQIGASDEASHRMARAIARESKGSPFLVQELARSNVLRRDAQASTLSLVTLAEIVAERLGRLSDASRSLAGLVAVAGRPLPLRTLAAAVGDAEGVDASVEALRTERLVRTGFRDGHETLEPSHDRIRETLVDMLPAADVRDRHARLARTLEVTAATDLEALAIHFLGSGNIERGTSYAERAAEQAVTKLAFAQATRLYELTIDARPASAPDLRRLQVRLGQVAEWAGLAEKAARAYLAAAAGAPTIERLNLERAAAAQLLASGRIEDGIAVFRRVLEAVERPVPGSVLATIFGIVVYRILSVFAVTRFKKRPATRELKPDERVRLEALQAVGRGLALVDAIAAMYVRARFLVDALSSGDRGHIVHAAASEAASLAARGGAASRRERTLFELAKTLAVESGDDEGYGIYENNLGIAQFLRGQWRASVQTLEDACAHQTASRTWQANANLYMVYSLTYRGELHEVKSRTQRLVADAARRGDDYTLVNLEASHPVAGRLAADDLDGARRVLRTVMSQWTNTRFLVQHWQAMIWEAAADLYAGDGPRAWERLERDDRRMKRSLLLNIQLIRILQTFVRGGAALGSLEGLSGDPWNARWSVARQAATTLDGERMVWSRPLAALLWAGIARARGDFGDAERHLRHAIDHASQADMVVHAEAARRALGVLLRDAGRVEEGTKAIEDADAALRARGVRVPERYVRMLIPGPREPEVRVASATLHQEA